MDRNFNELQRYCESHPEDLAAGERLFNHYLRLKDPYFLKIQEFFDELSDCGDIKNLFKILIGLPGKKSWAWLTFLIREKIDGKEVYGRHVSEEQIQEYPTSLSRKRISSLIQSLDFDFTEKPDSQARFKTLFSLFPHVREFHFDLKEIDYQATAAALPEHISKLRLTGLTDEIEPFLDAIQSKSITALVLDWHRHICCEEPGAHYQKQVLSFPSKIRQTLHSLHLDRAPTDLATVLLGESWPELESLQIWNSETCSGTLRSIVDFKIFPKLQSCYLIGGVVLSLPSKLELKPITKRSPIKDFAVISLHQTIEQYRELQQLFYTEKLRELGIFLTGGGKNEDIQELFKTNPILESEALEIDLEHVTGSLNYDWLTELKSEGLKKFCINFALEENVSEQVIVTLNDFAKSLLKSPQFPNLEEFYFGRSNYRQRLE